MEQDLLKLKIGTKESIKLTPEIVLIEKVEILPKTKGNIVECHCKHPDREEPIRISKVKLELKSKLSISGLWLNIDEEENSIVKSSALAKFLIFMKSESIEELQNKTCATVEDDSGYLVLKGY